MNYPYPPAQGDFWKKLGWKIKQLICKHDPQFLKEPFQGMPRMCVRCYKPCL